MNPGVYPMSQIDVDTVRTEFETWKSERAVGLPGGIGPFEVFCAGQLLKDHNLSDDEILYGSVGKSGSVASKLADSASGRC